MNKIKWVFGHIFDPTQKRMVGICFPTKSWTTDIEQIRQKKRVQLVWEDNKPTGYQEVKREDFLF